MYMDEGKNRRRTADTSPKSLPTCEQQQAAIDEIADKLGVVVIRKTWLEGTDGKNTMLLYLKEDYEQNKKEEQRSKAYPITDFTESGYHKTIEKSICREHFWRFENTDANGCVNCGFANYGEIDFRCSRWKEALEGHIRFALAKARKFQHIGRIGGWGCLMEADDIYNGLNREFMTALKQIHGTAFLGSVNFHGEDHKLVALGEKSIYEEYVGQPLYNFCCDYCVPTKDEELEKMIRAWNADDTLPKRRVDVEAITSRIEAIGGINLIWF